MDEDLLTSINFVTIFTMNCQIISKKNLKNKKIYRLIFEFIFNDLCWNTNQQLNCIKFETQIMHSTSLLVEVPIWDNGVSEWVWNKIVLKWTKIIFQKVNNSVQYLLNLLIKFWIFINTEKWWWQLLIQIWKYVEAKEFN